MAGVVSVVVSPEAESAGLNRFVVVASSTARIHTASIVGGSHVSAKENGLITGRRAEGASPVGTQG